MFAVEFHLFVCNESLYKSNASLRRTAKAGLEGLVQGLERALYLLCFYFRAPVLTAVAKTTQPVKPVSQTENIAVCVLQVLRARIVKVVSNLKNVL